MKKKLILVTQRVHFDQKTKERRDSLDQRWSQFLEKCGFISIVISNNSNFTIFRKKINFDGILFTGGNSLIKYGGSAIERDFLEKEILKYSIKKKIPLIGVCRGMQVIQDYFNTRLVRVKNQVSPRQVIVFKKKKTTVNSFHDYGSYENTKNFKTLAFSNERIIKAFHHIKLPILGIMWHPERYKTFKEEDISLFKNFFKNLL